MTSPTVYKDDSNQRKLVKNGENIHSASISSRSVLLCYKDHSIEQYCFDITSKQYKYIDAKKLISNTTKMVTNFTDNVIECGIQSQLFHAFLGLAAVYMIETTTKSNKTYAVNVVNVIV